MATLQKIRNKAGLLVAIIIGMALFAFILGDLLSSGSSIFSKKQMEVAEIGGVSISYQDYNAKIEELSEIYRRNYQLSSIDQEMVENIREEVWSNTVRDIVLGSSIDDLGLMVSVDELKIMLMGDSIRTGNTSIIMDEPHPIVKRMFTNPETGEFNRFQMMNYFNAISDDVYKEERKQWIYIEDQIVDERLGQKYFTMVRKGIRPNSIETKYYASETASTIDFNYDYVNFNTIPDAEITVSEDELEEYYEAHKSDFLQTEGRSIEYVIFNIQASEKDYNVAEESIIQAKEAFERAENPIAFVNTNSDLPYREVNYSPSELPESYSDSIFNASPGYVAGPWFEDESYKLARLIGFEQVPDSVKARHILISQSVQRDEARTKAIADSLKTLIDRGQSFDALARHFSADQSNREIGGDLGWFKEGAMVKPFSDAAFQNNKGDVVVVKTRFGHHIIKIDDQSQRVKKAKVAFMIRQVIPSDETYQTIYSQAVQFRANANNLDQFRNLYAESKLTPRFATDFQKDSKTLPGLEESREIIRWAFENEENAISQIFDLNDKYVVAALTDVKEEGIADFENVKTEVEIAVKKEKKLSKLAENVNSKIAGVNDIQDAASALNSEVSEAQKVRFVNPYVSGVGLEPNVVAYAFNMDVNSLSKAVEGENGVFVLSITDKTVPEELDLASAEFRLKYGIESRVTFEGYEALKDAAGVDDKRIRFY
jgi:peptidyl-prolyl cis-trans isomerase D